MHFVHRRCLHRRRLVQKSSTTLGLLKVRQYTESSLHQWFPLATVKVLVNKETRSTSIQYKLGLL